MPPVIPQFLHILPDKNKSIEDKEYRTHQQAAVDIRHGNPQSRGRLIRGSGAKSETSHYHYHDAEDNDEALHAYIHDFLHGRTDFFQKYINGKVLPLSVGIGCSHHGGPHQKIAESLLCHCTWII